MSGMSIKAAAHLADVSVSRINQLVKQGRVERTERGRVAYEDIIRYIAQRKEGRFRLSLQPPRYLVQALRNGTKANIDLMVDCTCCEAGIGQYCKRVGGGIHADRRWTAARFGTALLVIAEAADE